MKRLLPVLMGAVLLLLSSTEWWSLPLCEGRYSKTTWADCVGTYTFANGKFTLVNGKMANTMDKAPNFKITGKSPLS